MNPALIIAIISLVEEAVKNEPAIVAELSAIFSKPSPTPADWQAIRDRVVAQTYESLVPDSTIPPGQ